MKGYVLVEVPEKCSVGGCAIYESCRQRYNPCPIKPLPGKRRILDYDNKIARTLKTGWNACLDKILEKGETFDE